jgi:hypothetical protein
MNTFWDVAPCSLVDSSVLKETPASIFRVAEDDVLCEWVLKVECWQEGWGTRNIVLCYVCPSERIQQLGSHWTGFHEMLIFEYFSKICLKNSSFFKYDKNNRYFTWRPIYIIDLSPSFFLRMRNDSDKICRENQNTHFVFSNFFSKLEPCMRDRGADKSLARPTSRCIFLMVRIFRLMLVLLYIYIYIYIYI